MRILNALVAVAVTGALPFAAVGQTAANAPLKIGVMTDLSSLYSPIGGKGSGVATRMAVEDFGGKVLGRPIEVVVGDHQNKVDVATALAKRWVDVDGVRAFSDVAASSTAIAVQAQERDRQKAVVLISGGGARPLADEECSPVGTLWSWNTYSVGSSTARALVERGAKKWFFITADYAFGHSLEKAVGDVVKASGGTVVGSVRHPLNSPDFSSYLLRAQSSGADVIALANAGGDMINGVKQAGEFGITESGKKLATLLTFITDIHGIGLKQAQGLTLTTSFYWNRTPETRAWSQRFFKQQGAMPTMVQASTYSSVLHYLKAVQAAGTDEPKAVMAKMRELRVNDKVFAENGWIREDGIMMHDFYLAQVKKPAESKEPWDYYDIVATIPAEKAFWPLSESKCKMVKK
ncbi:ABC transporter substrate-binding protein [Ramlibacter sp. RBP-2]|uniref:ABC transporter substrate-binding protein n=1 Tax=Ramlibacter lithotrophicus TaxID=2606681 RepID=A0A7X6DFD6_9BURK|nr:ABC transporter substrate-binding protein [Ramlibacter lithotrophicus]NKE66112.1 ABC transporter substrate-binding protein [Ramlibacter lithotrophicus]